MTKIKYHFFIKACTILSACLFAFIACNQKSSNALDKISADLQIITEKGIRATISHLNSIETNLNNKEEVKKEFLKARKSFKEIEVLLAFAEKENYASLNHANLTIVDEDSPSDIKILEPFGLQVLEEQLFDGEIDSVSIKRNINKTVSRLKLVEKNLFFNFKKHHLFWMMRDEIIRISTTDIAGFDSPVLLNSLEENQHAYNGITEVLNACSELFMSINLHEDFKQEIRTSIELFNTDFESFDRYNFIKNHAETQLKMLQEIAEDWQIDFPFELAISNSAKSLYSKTSFNVPHFTQTLGQNDKLIKQKVALGKKLFNDSRLSGGEELSCATCHKSDLAFTDTLATFKNLKRNSPTVTYAALQNSFFWDARAGSLEGQMLQVVNNADEFNTSIHTINEKLLEDSVYIALFEETYQSLPSRRNIQNAVAAYVSDLNEFSSKFDENIRGERNDLSKSEIRGFNVFMGKAACGTCHFPPLFNGTIPPDFSKSELEALGVPDEKNKQKLDDDLGRYAIFKTAERRHFFKTPTLRNIDFVAALA